MARMISDCFCFLSEIQFICWSCLSPSISMSQVLLHGGNLSCSASGVRCRFILEGEFSGYVRPLETWAWRTCPKSWNESILWIPKALIISINNPPDGFPRECFSLFIRWRRIFFSCVCLLASMARSVNCLGRKNAVQVHLIGAKPIVQVKRWNER